MSIQDFKYVVITDKEEKEKKLREQAIADMIINAAGNCNDEFKYVDWVEWETSKELKEKRNLIHQLKCNGNGLSETRAIFIHLHPDKHIFNVYVYSFSPVKCTNHFYDRFGGILPEKGKQLNLSNILDQIINQIANGIIHRSSSDLSFYSSDTIELANKVLSKSFI